MKRQVKTEELYRLAKEKGLLNNNWFFIL